MPNYASEAIAFFDRDRRADARMTQRQAIWLSTMLAREPDNIFSVALHPDGEIDWDEIRLRIYDALDQLPQVNHRLRRLLVEQLLPEDELPRITTDPEQIKWLRKALQDRPGRKGYLGKLTPLRLEPKDELILELDLWEADRQTKRTFVERLKDAWGASTQQHRLLRWFDDEEYEKCDLLWAWLYKNRPSLLEGRTTFKHRAQVQSFFNDTGLRPDEINYIVNTIKTRWSQRKYRETNKDKKQFNFVLSKNADRVLDKLAKARGLSRSQVLELLIHEEGDRGNKKGKW
ncbi:ribbon-helix-helix protein, CopG family [Burkholderia ubonensis]|uniref:ribbon-helix-helix protein, CopG family n=1 Tax=Burkholderia ubonensis TaxID=101571 RepID=UPI002AB06701|nr:ribbon-helix-helix protein, CopG family [Burkholderia ubonensis]